MDRKKKTGIINILVLGAKLQGTEVIYLAKKAGYHVTVVDKKSTALGIDLADEYVKADILDESKVIGCIKRADVVIPAIEDTQVLDQVIKYGEKTGTKVLFDKESYRISSSKSLSNKLFEELELPMPKQYPACEYPVIMKPDHLSGSSNVKKAYSAKEAEAYLKKHGKEKVVIQEYLEGPSYSLEVIGNGTEFYFPQITEVIVDDNYDCKRIIAPAVISEDVSEQMMTIGRKLSDKLKIKGIFDIEVILHKGKLKLLEIDARFPSQTPISVYHSTGINMVELMVNQAFGKFSGKHEAIGMRSCIYQQILVSDGKIEVLGEHIMGSCRHLKQIMNFYGADEVMTDYYPGAKTWKAIVIITRDSQKEAMEAFEEFTRNISAIQTEKAG